MSEAVMEMYRLGKRYAGAGLDDGLWAVRGVTLNVYAGDVTVLMGPSGSGKTTLLSMIGGLLAPTEGYLSVCGTTLDDCGEHERQQFRRKHVGFIFQSYNLLQALTAAENVATGLYLRGLDPARATECLAQVGLAEAAARYPHELSGGQRQRVAIARALAGEPAVLLADEPTAALDAEQGRLVMGLLRKRAKDCNAAVLVVTHDPRVRDFADRVIEMEDGRLHRIVRRLRKNRPPAPTRLRRDLLKESSHVRA